MKLMDYLETRMKGEEKIAWKEMGGENIMSCDLFLKVERMLS